MIRFVWNFVCATGALGHRQSFGRTLREMVDGVLGPDTRDPRERSGWVSVNVSAAFLATEIQ
jgi:hypothetical protein